MASTACLEAAFMPSPVLRMAESQSRLQLLKSQLQWIEAMGVRSSDLIELSPKQGVRHLVYDDLK